MVFWTNKNLILINLNKNKVCMYQHIIKASEIELVCTTISKGDYFFLINSVQVMATAYLTQNFHVKEIPQSQRQIL